MKQLLLLILLFSSSLRAQEVITNETIIKLTKAKLNETTITQKITNSACNFDISTDALIKLKVNNVTDKVVEYMINKQSAVSVRTNEQNKNNMTETGFIFEESGIYFLENEKYTMLDPTNVSTPALKAGLLQGGGLVGAKYKSHIEGGEANYQLKNNLPVFYFNFDNSKKSLNNSGLNEESTGNYMSDILRTYSTNGQSTAISPNDFKLLKLTKLKGKREYVSGKVGVFSGVDMSASNNTFSGSYFVNFKYEKVTGNTYKITFQEDLKPGEYCFLYSSNTSVYEQNKAKVFDFGIMKPNY